MQILYDNYILTKMSSDSSINVVPGFFLFENIFSEDEEKKFMEHLEAEPGHFVSQIRPSHEFGWKFLERKGVGKPSISPLSQDEYLGPLPSWVLDMWEKCKSRNALPDGCRTSIPDHAIANVYKPGDGCTGHVDDIHFWNDWVVGVSFGSGVMLQLRSTEGPFYGPSINVWIPPKSVYVLSGEARYKHTHGIEFATSDIVKGETIKRGIRTSVTFRTIHKKYLSDGLRREVQIKKDE